MRGLHAVLVWGGWSRLAALATALTAVAALWFSAQSLRATHSQMGLTEQGQLTDRFGKAVEQIGSTSLDVRLGGIYALERLARDSARDHPTVMEVLSTLVRSHAPYHLCPQPAQEAVKHEPDRDVQAAITVISRRDAGRDGPYRIDLGATCLMGARLSRAKLAGANLRYSNLTRADLSQSDLIGADFYSANLYGANLRSANLTNANIADAYVVDANFIAADLTNVLVTDSQRAYSRGIHQPG